MKKTQINDLDSRKFLFDLYKHCPFCDIKLHHNNQIKKEVIWDESNSSILMPFECPECKQKWEVYHRLIPAHSLLMIKPEQFTHGFQFHTLINHGENK